MSIAYIEYYWMGNCQDDGFYVNKISTLSYIKNSFIINPATGIINNDFSTYNLLSGELLSSVYVNILHIDGAIYTRLFLSAFNYFLLLNVLVAISNKIYDKSNWKFNKYYLQFVSVIILLFVFSSDFLVYNHLLRVTDSWQFTSAMYYGSSVVKTMGLLLLTLPFLDKDKLKFSDFLIYGVVATVLFCKSAIALPIVVLFGFSYLMSHLIVKHNKKHIIICAGILFILLIISIFLKDSNKIDSYVIEYIIWNIKTVPFIVCIMGFILGFFLKIKEIYKLNIAIVIFLIMIILNPLNNIFSTLSVYLFVAARSLTLLIYTIYMVSSLYIGIFIFKVVKKKYIVVIIYMILVVLFFIGSIKSFEDKYGSIIDAYRILKTNSHFMPNSTVKLGEKLEKLSKKSRKKINALFPEWYRINGYEHSLSILIRIYAPHINSISALGRYPTSNKKYKKYSVKEAKIYNEFHFDPDDKKFDNLKKVLNTYSINCVVFDDNNNKEYYMKKAGFILYDYVEDGLNGAHYYIYYKGDN